MSGKSRSGPAARQSVPDAKARTSAEPKRWRPVKVAVAEAIGKVDRDAAVRAKAEVGDGAEERLVGNGQPAPSPLNQKKERETDPRNAKGRSKGEFAFAIIDE
jgi:hypothetical protein